VGKSTRGSSAADDYLKQYKAAIAQGMKPPATHHLQSSQPTPGMGRNASFTFIDVLGRTHKWVENYNVANNNEVWLEYTRSGPNPLFYVYDVPWDKPLKMEHLSIVQYLDGFIIDTTNHETDPDPTNNAAGSVPAFGILRGVFAPFPLVAGRPRPVIPKERQTFTDVPFGSPYWEFIEIAVQEGWISGHGTAPNRTFLPMENLVRGAGCKLIVNAVFPL
jgi:hypothetical protein